MTKIMKNSIKSLLLITFLINTSQLYCMNKDNITKPEHKTIEEFFTDKNMKIILKNELRENTLTQQEQCEQEIDWQFAKRVSLGAIVGGAVLYTIESVSIFTWGMYLLLTLIKNNTE